MDRPRMDLDLVTGALGDFTEDAILITEAEPIEEPGPRIVWCNAAFTRMTGYALEEVAGETPRILQGPDSDRATLDRLRAGLEAWQPTRVELKNYRKDGTPFWVEFIVRPVADEDGWFHYWVSVQRETTDRVEREALLEKTTRVLDAAPVGFGLLTHDQRVAYANPVLERTIFGTDTPALLDRPYQNWLRHAVVRGLIREARESPGDWLRLHMARLFSGRFLVEQPINGVWYEFRRLVMSDGSALLSVSDIEDRRTLQEQLQQASRLEAMGQITGGVAHDFNNLLTVILGNLELLRTPVAHPDRDEFIEQALDATLRGRELTNSLLSFARKARLEPSLVRIDEVVRRSRPVLARVLPETIDLVVDTPESLPSALVDRALLENAILNLAINARDAIDGRGTIRLTAREVRPTELPEPQIPDPDHDRYVCVIVEDDGAGIPEDDLPKVIEPFFSTKEVGEGSGLGLSLVHGFVQQSGGILRIESDNGEGTRVWLALPTASTMEPGEAPPLESETPGRARRVFLVEDDAAVRRVTEAMLRSLGCTCESAENGTEALRLLRTEAPFDLILTDLSMPGPVQGDEVARHVLSTRPGTPVIMMCDNPEALTGATLQGSARFTVLQKPVRRSELAEAVRQSMGELSGRGPQNP